jgi:alpha-tubulin suppressor-like RCC1 family protein
MPESGSTMFAIDSRGTTWAWGQNDLGQVGTGTERPDPLPTRIGIDLSCVSSTASWTFGLWTAGVRPVVRPDESRRPGIQCGQ